MHHAFRTFALAAVAALAAGCKGNTRVPAELSGPLLSEPVARPRFTLTATDGQPYDFHERTKGRTTLLFFGYTNYPDACPVHAANVATVLRSLTWEERQKLDFVFVTTDPDRDSLPAIRKWLDHFDSSFVGLWGPRGTVDSIQRSMNIGVVPLGEKREDGSYDVGHFSAVIAFEPDDLARAMYPFGVRQEHWAHDIPILLTRHAR